MIGLKLHTLCQDLRGDNLLKQHVNESPPPPLLILISHAPNDVMCMRLESHGFGGKVRFAWLNSQHSLSLSSSCHWRVQKEVLLISPLHTGKFQPVTKPLSMFEAIKALFFSSMV